MSSYPGITIHPPGTPSPPYPGSYPGSANQPPKIGRLMIPNQAPPPLQFINISFDLEKTTDEEQYARDNLGKRVSWYVVTFGGMKTVFGCVVGYMRKTDVGYPAVVMEPEDPSWGRKFDDYLVKSFPEGTIQILVPGIQYISGRAIKDLMLVGPKRKLPHICTECKSPALQLFNMVDCSNATCRHYRPE